ncbi:MAG: hypothetical protein P8J33_11975 [Pirellulaceae bacterium]|nr:hypothetical protein [Pirellulaceae bacterium]
MYGICKPEWKTACRLWILLLAATLVGAGCRKPIQESDLGDAPFSSDATTNGTVPTDEECEAFASQLQEQVFAKNASAVNDSINWNAIIDRAVSEIPVASATKNGFRNGVLQSVGQSQGMAAQIIQQMERGGDYRYLGTREVGDEKRVLFRLLLADDGGVNYHDMVVLKDQQGQLKAVDIYVLMSAEFLSKTLRRMFLPLAAEQSKSILEKLTKSDSDFINNIQKIQMINQLYQSGKFSQVENIYSTLPDSMKREKTISLIRLQAAAKISDQKYAEAIKDFRSFHPNDPCVNIISIDSFFLKGQFDEALKCIDRLDESVGGDPYLNVMRANITLAQGDTAATRTLAKAAIDKEATLTTAYWLLVNAALADKNHDEVVQYLNLLNENFTVEFDDLTQIPEYADFVKSPQYRDWLRTR